MIFRVEPSALGCATPDVAKIRSTASRDLDGTAKAREWRLWACGLLELLKVRDKKQEQQGG